MATKFGENTDEYKARDLIESFERIFRIFIQNSLKDYYHEQWWELGISQPIRERISRQIENKLKKEPKKNHKKIEEFNFNDYKNLIFRKHNWSNIFQKYFHQKSNIEFPLDKLRLIRNDISHARSLNKKDLRKIETYIDDIFNYIPDEFIKDSITLSKENRSKFSEEYISLIMGNIEKIKKFKELMPSKSIKRNLENNKEIQFESIPNPTTLKPKSNQTEVPIITTERIMSVLSSEWQPLEILIFKLKVQEKIDARYIRVKLKELERKGMVLVEFKIGKTHWRLK